MTRIVYLFDPLRKALLVTAAAAAIATFSGSPAFAAIAYDESGSPDLSNTGLAPTPISMGIGSNTILGSSGHDVTGAIDRDYFTFTLGANEALTAINVLPGTQTLGFSFIGIQAGNQVTLPVFPADATGLLGWYHYSGADIGTDILDNMSVANNGSSGFAGSLGPGTYSVWVQEISSGGAVPYAFDFVVAPVPEPTTWAMMLLGFGAIGFAARRSRKGQFVRPSA